MIINPKSKFKWIEEHWLASEAADVKKWMVDARSASTSSHPSKSHNVISNKFRACSSLRFHVLHEPEHCKAQCFVTLCITIFFKDTRADDTNNTDISKYAAPPTLPNLTALPVPVAIPPTKVEAALEAEEHARDLRTVRNELSRYKEDPLFAESALLDLVRYWDESESRRKLLIHLAIK